MYMYQVRKLLASRNKGASSCEIATTGAYDAALRKDQIGEIADGEAYLTPTGQDDVIGVLFNQIGSLGEEVAELQDRLNRMEAGK